MATDQATERVKRELHRAIDHMRTDLDKVELLSAALNAFSKPVPEYEPAFRHLPQVALNAHELGG